MKKLFSLSLAVVMVVSLLCTPAHASWLTVYVNEDSSVTVCENRSLSSAQKISSLLSMVYPVDRLSENLAQLRKFNDYDYALYHPMRSGMDEGLASYLGESTRSALSVICPKDAYQLMQWMKAMPEYAENPEVKRYVDDYLDWPLSGSEVRWGLEVLTNTNLSPSVAYDPYFDRMELSELIQFADDVVKTDEYEAFLRSMQELKQGDTDAYALTCRYTATELDALWDELAATANVYWPGYVRMLNEMQITTPVTTYPSMEDYYRDMAG